MRAIKRCDRSFARRFSAQALRAVDDIGETFVLVLLDTCHDPAAAEAAAAAGSAPCPPHFADADLDALLVRTAVTEPCRRRSAADQT